MLITVQFPFADLRPFLDVPTNRLTKPAWPIPRFSSEFVRSFGAVKNRRRGGVDEWPDEHAFCDSRNAIRFASEFPKRTSPEDTRRVCAFRRLFSDGLGTVRVEVGIAFRGRYRFRRPLETLSLLQSTVSLPVRVGPRTDFKATQLIAAERALAIYLLEASTRAAASFTPEAWWFSPGAPAVLLEYDTARDQVALPPHLKPVTDAKQYGVDLAFGWINLARRTVGVWFFGMHPDSDRDYRRRLRIHLLRLHAQRETVKEVLRAIVAKRLSVKRTEKNDPLDLPANLLQQFLADAIDRLEKNEHSGILQSELLRAAAEFQDLVSAGERTSLLQTVQPLRRTVFQAVARYTTGRAEPGQAIIVVESGGTYHVTNNTQNVNISGGTFQGDFTVQQIVADKISESFNRVQKSGASSDMKTRLEELHKLVGDLVKKLPPEEQEKAVKNLDVLAKEATASKPDRAWYEVSASGLIEAAKTVAEMAAPITTAVKAVLALLV